MIRYFQWLSIAGVWLPLAILAFWFAVISLAPASTGWGIAVFGVIVALASAHALAVSSLIGLFLIATRNTSRVAATAVSALVGGACAALVLARIYFNVGG